MATVRVRCPAKVNLFLEILGRRPDGYHEIATVMAPISLADGLELSAAGRDTIEIRPARTAPADATNTAMKAIAALRKIREFPPVRIRLRKRVPSGAGLGGGSSDAAGAVKAADRLFHLRLTEDETRSTLAAVGSDTVFFAARRWALCTGRGEIVTPLPSGRALALVLVAPPFQNPTGEIYKRFRPVARTRNAARFMAVLEGGADLTPHLFNRLEKPAFEYQPSLRHIKHEMEKLPFEAVMMTGSGSALFGLCRNRGQQRIRAKELRSMGLGLVFEAMTASR